MLIAIIAVHEPFFIHSEPAPRRIHSEPRCRRPLQVCRLNVFRQTGKCHHSLCHAGKNRVGRCRSTLLLPFPAHPVQDSRVSPPLRFSPYIKLRRGSLCAPWIPSLLSLQPGRRFDGPIPAMSAVIGPTLGVVQLATTLSGVPFASGGVLALQMINAACSQVSVHKVNPFWDSIVFC